MGKSVNIRYDVEYHPEALYFNKFVRDNGYEPWKDQWVWKNDTEWAPFQVCTLLLFELIQTPSATLPWPAAVERMLRETRVFKTFPEGVDVSAWLEYARSVNVEGMLDKYMPRIFGVFGQSFSVPTIKVSPVRLASCSPNQFRSLASGAYSPHHMCTADPAFYDLRSHFIYFPIPDRSTKLPPAFLDWVLLHELFHAAAVYWAVLSCWWMGSRHANWSDESGVCGVVLRGGSILHT